MTDPPAGADRAEHGARQRSFRQEGGSLLDEFIFRLRSRRILGVMPPVPSDIADLGSGHDFRLLRHLYRLGLVRHGLAVDVSLDGSAWIGADSVRLLEADLGRPLDVPDASVDVVLSMAVLEHMAAPHVHVSEAHRILRSPGVMLMTSPSRASRPLLEFLAYRLHVIDADEIRDHRHYFEESEIRTLLAAAGFAPGEVSYQRFLFGLNQFVVARKG